MRAMRWGILCFGIVFLVSCAEKKEHKGYLITGSIEGLDDGMVYLESVNQENVKDSALVEYGEFRFEGTLQEPLMYRLKLKGEEYGVNFILTNEDIQIQANKDSLFKASVTGASENKVYRDFYDNEFVKIREKAGPIYRLSDSITQKGKVEMTSEQRAMMDKKWIEMNNYSDSVTTGYILKNSNSIASAIIIKDRYITYPNYTLASKLYDSLSLDVQQSYFGKQLWSSLEVYRTTAVGNNAPGFTLPDVDGNMVNLSDYKGKYVFIDFWASWCAPCRKENPNVVMAYHKYKDSGLEIIGISLDSKKELWVKAINEDGLSWLHLSDLRGFENEAAKKYGVNAIPQNFLIGPNGQIIGKNLRGENLLEKLQEVFEPKS